MRLLRAFGPFVALILFAGCSNGSSTAPVAGNSGAPQGGVVAGAQSGAQIALPASGPVTSGTLTLPTVTSGAGAGLSIKVLSGSSATQSTVRRAEAINNTTAFAEITIVAASAVTFSGTFSANITVPGGPLSYFAGFADQTGAVAVTGPLASINSIYSDTSPAGTYSLNAGDTLAFDFATSNSFVTPSPSGGNVSAIAFKPNALSFISTGAAAAQTVTMSEAGYNGSFTATSENTAIATVSVSGTTLTVTPTGPGTTSIDVSGAAAAKLSVVVTTSPVTVQ